MRTQRHRRRIAVLTVLLFGVGPLFACSLIAGLDKDFVEVACIRDCADATQDTSTDRTTSDTTTPISDATTDSGGEAGDPCGFVDVTDPSVVNNPDYAGWPMPTESVANVVDYTVEGDVFIDKVTKLRWRKTPPPDKITFTEAKSYCDGLDADGGPKWRLPTRIELVSLQFYHPLNAQGSFDPPCHSNVFDTPDDALAWFWSSTTVPDNATTTWAIYSSGCGAAKLATTSPVTTPKFYVRCVQGPEAKARFQISEKCNLVRDLNTHLEWQRGFSSTKYREDPEGGVPIELAKNKCSELGLGFVIPKQNELYSIIDTSRTSSPLLNPVLFPNAPSSGKLISASFRDAPGIVAAIQLPSGEEEGAFFSELAVLKCVRYFTP